MFYILQRKIKKIYINVNAHYNRIIFYYKLGLVRVFERRRRTMEYLTQRPGQKLKKLNLLKNSKTHIS